MHLSLTLINGEKLEFQVAATTVTIGRSPKCNVVINHEGISRQHCQIEITAGRMFVTDLNSTNGVYIDGEKINPGVRTLYLTYLSLSFGAVHSAFIELGNKSVEQKPTTDRKTGNYQTATLKLELEELPPRVKMRKKEVIHEEEMPEEDEEPRRKFKPLYAMMVIIVAGVIAWYFTDTDESKKKEVITSENQK